MLHGMTNHAAAESGAGARHEPKTETQGGRLFVFPGKNDVVVGKKVTVCFPLRKENRRCDVWAESAKVPPNRLMSDSRSWRR